MDVLLQLAFLKCISSSHRYPKQHAPTMQDCEYSTDLSSHWTWILYSTPRSSSYVTLCYFWRCFATLKMYGNLTVLRRNCKCLKDIEHTYQDGRSGLCWRRALRSFNTLTSSAKKQAMNLFELHLNPVFDTQNFPETDFRWLIPLN